MVEPRPDIGLVGDGDEVAAIKEVEREFGVRLPYGDAADWITAGDVCRSLNKVMPANEGSEMDRWAQFATAISRETGIDPFTVTPDTELVGAPTFWSHLTFASATLWAIIGAGIALAVGLTLI